MWCERFNWIWVDCDNPIIRLPFHCLYLCRSSWESFKVDYVQLFFTASSNKIKPNRACVIVFPDKLLHLSGSARLWNKDNHYRLPSDYTVWLFALWLDCRCPMTQSFCRSTHGSITSINTWTVCENLKIQDMLLSTNPAFVGFISWNNDLTIHRWLSKPWMMVSYCVSRWKCCTVWTCYLL